MRIRQTRAMAENDKVHHYLIVTDHALDDQQLAATVQPSLAAGPCQFYLLVLATPAGTKDRVLWGALSGAASAPNPGPAAEQGWDRAREQLAHNLGGLRKLGADADGETGEPPALRALLGSQPVYASGRSVRSGPPSSCAACPTPRPAVGTAGILAVLPYPILRHVSSGWFCQVIKEQCTRRVFDSWEARCHLLR